MGNYLKHVSTVCVGGCLCPWPYTKVSNEDQEGGLVVCTLDINTEILIALSYATLRKCTMNNHHTYIHFLKYNIHTVIHLKNNNQSIIKHSKYALV